MQAANKSARRCWELSLSWRFLCNLNLILAKALARISGTLIKWLSLPHRSYAVTLINHLCAQERNCWIGIISFAGVWMLEITWDSSFIWTDAPYVSTLHSFSPSYSYRDPAGMLWDFSMRTFYSICISGWPLLKSFRSLEENAWILQSSLSV